jgi:hypothetical protein
MLKKSQKYANREAKAGALVNNLQALLSDFQISVREISDDLPPSAHSGRSRPKSSPANNGSRFGLDSPTS